MRPLEGIHHISAITGDAIGNLDFYTRVMGLRLVAKTVNQDDPSVYHLFYADEEGHPGADLTFFEYKRAIPGRPGAGMVHRIVWRVADEEALAFWEARLASENVDVERADSDTLIFADREGLAHELLISDAPDAPLIADHPEIPAAVALRGFEGVRMYSRAPDASKRVLRDLLGAIERPDGAFELRGARRGGWVAIDRAPALPANQSAGTVHHVAFAVDGHDEHGRWIEAVDEAGMPSSGRVDRTYFEALYFREPGGVLYELSTLEPGFTVDDPVEDLGKRIILPPWLEEHRALIEANLTPLPDPRAGWPVRAS
jgi:glyoxalase family protein